MTVRSAYFGSSPLPRLMVLFETMNNDNVGSGYIDVLVPPMRPRNPAARFYRDLVPGFVPATRTECFDRPSSKHVSACIMHQTLV